MQYWRHKTVINSPICLQPTPIVMGDFIRIYAGHFPTSEVIGHVGFFDYYPSSNKVNNHTYSVLSPGEPGMFDSFGTIPTCVIPNYAWRNDIKYWMFYAGYQQLKDVRFCAFGGMAYSKDGTNFTRYTTTPWCERTVGNELFHVIHWVLPYTVDFSHAWIGGGNTFIQGNSKTLPVYTVKYCELFRNKPYFSTEHPVIDLHENEHRVGRPTVIFKDGLYNMWYCYGEEGTYNIGYAESTQARSQFIRKDDQIDFEYKVQMRAYPAVVEFNNDLYMFYNTAYGKDLISKPEIVVAIKEET